MRAAGWIGIVTVTVAVTGACTRSGPDPATTPASTAPPAAAPPAASSPPPASPPPAPPEAAPPPTMRTDDGRCTPMPTLGDACRTGDGWCVESWGEPGGHSSALWCRDGTWQREQEVNLPQ